MTEGIVEVVRRFWDAIQARDWELAGEQLHDDVEFVWPNTGEHFAGRDNVIGMNRAYPEGWTIELQRTIAEGDVVVTEVRVPHETLGVSWAASFFEIRDGRIARAVEYWIDEGEKAPDWRAPFRDSP
jgi:ketosteroid isomerase-like protein